MVNLLSKSFLIVLDELEYRIAKLIEQRLKRRALRMEHRRQKDRPQDVISGAIDIPDSPVTSPSDFEDEITWASNRQD
jgi:hypothetical protein